LAQPSVTTFGYSRATLPGIPGVAKDIFPPTYYLYVEVAPGTRVSAEWAWVQGKYYDCRLMKVNAPVQVERDPGVPTETKETLVPQTSNDVYSVSLVNVRTRTPSTGQERELTRNNDAVVALMINGSRVYAAVRSIKALRPAAAP
jgi:hypothetical protein